MTPDKIALLRDSWTKVEPVADMAAALFYDRLFTIAPEVRPMFKSTDMKRQHRMLTDMLTTVVRDVDDPDALAPSIAALGRRHIAHGARPEQFDAVGAALLWTLEKGMAEQWTTAHQEAWSEAYGHLSGAMRQAMRGAAKAA